MSCLTIKLVLFTFLLLGCPELTSGITLKILTKLLNFFPRGRNTGGNFFPRLTEHLRRLTDPRETDEISLEARLNTPELIRHYGYPVEEHTVQTADGYVLTMHRIPRSPRNSTDGKEKRIPVVLFHDYSASSILWVFNTPEKSLGFLLADEGYDVWLGNVRGNAYTRKHITLSPTQRQFWNFSMDEHGKFDLPAMIDYILHTTQFEQLLCVGHAVGAAEILILLSSRPEYNKKVKGAALFAPISTLTHMRATFKGFMPIFEILKFTMESLGIYEYLNWDLNHLVYRYVCKNDLGPSGCEYLFSHLYGFYGPQLNTTRVPIYLAHYPDSTSSKTIYHFAQIYRAREFIPYDYGSEAANQIAYNQRVPPPYELHRISAPIAIFWGEADVRADPDDVAWLAQKLPNVFLNYRVPLKEFNHGDFIWAIDIKELVFNKLFSTLRELWESG